MLRDLMDSGYIKAMIFITHELPLLYNVTDHIMVMYAGQLVELAKAREAVFDPLHPYSKGLMGSIIVPEEGLREVKLTAIPGVPPNLKKPPAGCRFAERCKYTQPQCRTPLGQEVREVQGGRVYRCIFPESVLRETYANEQAYRDAQGQAHGETHGPASRPA
jgi:peptide/nickel transport system ATP-binding protein